MGKRTRRFVDDGMPYNPLEAEETDYFSYACIDNALPARYFQPSVHMSSGQKLLQ